MGIRDWGWGTAHLNPQQMRNKEKLGVLCGRATWQDGIPEYGKGGATALRAWLSDRGVQNIQALNAVLARGAKPWWDFYGGKQNIEVVDLPA
jgi:tagatose 1,6-diphosphate aldolase